MSASADNVLADAAEENAPPPKKGYMPGQDLTARFSHIKPVMAPGPEDIMREDFQSFCLVRAAMHGVGGAVMGAAFGIFLGATDTSTLEVQGAAGDMRQRTAMQVLKETGRQIGSRTMSYGKQFASIGFLYSGIECCIEKHRGKHDIWNAVYAGGATGSLLARGAGPIGIIGGGLTFAGFSAAIEWYLGATW